MDSGEGSDVGWTDRLCGVAVRYWILPKLSFQASHSGPSASTDGLLPRYSRVGFLRPAPVSSFMTFPTTRFWETPKDLSGGPESCCFCLYQSSFQPHKSRLALHSLKAQGTAHCLFLSRLRPQPQPVRPSLLRTSLAFAPSGLGKSPPTGPQQPPRASARPRRRNLGSADSLGLGSGARTLCVPRFARDSRLVPQGKANGLVRHVLLRGAPGQGGWSHDPVGKEVRNEPRHCRRPFIFLGVSFCGGQRECWALDGLQAVARTLRPSPFPREAATASLRPRSSGEGRRRSCRGCVASPIGLGSLRLMWSRRGRRRGRPVVGLLLFRPSAEHRPDLRWPDRFLRPPAHRGGTLPIKPGDLVAVRLQRIGEDSKIVGSGLRVGSLESISLGEMGLI